MDFDYFKFLNKFHHLSWTLSVTGVIVKFLGISFERLPVSPILGFSISLKLNIMFLSECPSDITDGCSTHSSVEKKREFIFIFSV